MFCEKCGREIKRLKINEFNHEGIDSFVDAVYFEEADSDAVVIETNPAWTGYELSEEEMADTIECPHCGKFPFKNREIQVYTVVRVVCFKEGVNEER